MLELYMRGGKAMSMDRLTQVGEGLVKRFGTRDPLEIAEDIGIEVLSCDNFGPLMTRIVCAHEIGHDQLHRYLAKGDGLQEFMLYDMTTKPEYEANIVASEILLDSNEVLDYIFDYHYSAEEIARCMGTDINLVALKIAHLNELGYGFRNVDHRSDFLR